MVLKKKEGKAMAKDADDEIRDWGKRDGGWTRWQHTDSSVFPPRSGICLDQISYDRFCTCWEAECAAITLH